MKPPGWSLFFLSSAWLAMGAGPGDTPKPARPALEMSKAVVCKKVEGYEKFTELPDASLTSEDKLNVYFRPLNFRVDPLEKPRAGHRFKASFTEDCRIRRKGDKTPLMKKDKLLEYDTTFEVADYQIYLLNNISLKGLAPGEYELDVILHDVLEEGATATQSVAFTIIPIPKGDPNQKAEGTSEPESSPVPAKDSKKTKSKMTRAKP